MNYKENESEPTALFMNSTSQTMLKLASVCTADTEYDSESIYCSFPAPREKKSWAFSPDMFQSSIHHNITTSLCSASL